MNEKRTWMHIAKGIAKLNVKIKIKVYFLRRIFIQAIKKFCINPLMFRSKNKTPKYNFITKLSSWLLNREMSIIT